MIPNAESLEKTLKSRLIDAVESRCELMKSASYLKILGVDIGNLNANALNCMDEVTNKYIDDLCKKLTAHYANGTPAKIELNRELYQVGYHHRCGNRLTRQTVDLFHDCDNGENLEKEIGLVDIYLNQMDFTAIAAEINRQASELANEGLRLIALGITDWLGLRYLRRGVIVRSNRIVMGCYPFRYSNVWETINKLKNLQAGLALIEKDAGLSFGNAITDLIKAADYLNYDYQIIASRTKCGKGGNLEIHCFKDKHEYRFTKEAFDAVLAFISLNGFEDVANQVLDALNMAEAA
ncbi:hypothetical protein JCM14076_32800 [Methylosoma difficile]